jgi:hypothetical protein
MGDARWRVSALFSRLWFALLCAICVAACSPHIPVRPLPELHTPNISKVPGFEAYYKRNAGYVNDSLRDFTAYQPYGAGLSGRMLVEAGASLLDIGLDGSDGRKIADGDLCIDRPAVTRDSQWMACTTVYGRLIVQSLTEAPPYESHLLPTGATFPRLVAWGPDGRQLVAVETAESDCRLNVSRRDAVYGSAPWITDTRPPTGVAEFQLAPVRV